MSYLSLRPNSSIFHPRHLGPAALGIVLNASTFGLMLGAAAGGWLR
jgi:hypothetical protein